MAEKRRTREELKRERELQKKKHKKPVGTWIKRIVLTIVIIGIAGLIGGAGLFAVYASSAPELDEELLKDPISSEFYDKNGEVFATIGAESRKYVNYEDIPEEMVDAILATEDVRFFDHFGIDIWRLGSAVIANVTQGFGSQGASTITQQVVKNSFLSNDKKLKRKAQEAWLAIQLERQYEKEEIFEMYFNKILMSGRIYGFGTASEYFFGKEPSELELDEMALLAGIPQSPNRYNPYKNPERAQQRRDLVLDLMVQHKKITEEEAAAAKEIDVTSRLLAEEDRKTVAGTKYDAFLDVVLSELEENGDGEALAEGIKVYTTLDPNAQTAVEDIMNNPENFPTEDIQAGVSVVDTKTGEILAIGGGRNYGADRGFNFAHDLTTRSPGSTIKPLLDYGPAIENLKWSTGETTVDEKMTYSNSKQVITNFDNKYLGTMTVREALYQSRNVPAVKTLQEVGTENAEEFINKLGIETENVYESDAIGGGDITMSPIEMAAAYAAFGNKGIYSDPTAIKEVVYRDDTKKSYKSKQEVAMSDYTAYMVTDILRDVVSSKQGASGTAAAVSGLDIAGKTGTTNYDSKEFDQYDLPDSSVPDSWFAGYTTNYSIAIWGGYSKRSEPITTWDERRLPQRLFKSIMSEISADVETEDFKRPSSVVEATIEVGTSPLQLASDYTPSELRQTELFVKGTEPTQVSEEFEQLELNAPTNLKANYSVDGSLVDLTWDYNPPSEEDDEKDLDITFEVTMAVDNEKPVAVTTTPDTKATISNLEAGRNYTFSVVAVSKDVRSEPASVSIYIENAIEEPEVDSPEDPENGDGDDNENGNNGNGNGNGNNGNGNNGNGNGNGNGNNNGENEDFEDWFGPGEDGEVETPTEPTDPTETTE
ncbi:PBP1A family penicillin-binding protein [Lysinibacillus sp. SGAir0095]|uniref:PBP1A family penicillin-binding protein n=1 Tax=Lysinibacillus sp. SGAir0095 TaxID=2070463 RepID=UPI0010CD0AA1|nr:PBP1A family penicillin-binding protein [Lysinibacillus sp. SGAir0095]QCR32197.1 penicillin-binding protein [Lysinibacillus sp. SGAir0095]